MMASYNYSLCFHVSARTDKWLQYHIHSPHTNDDRGVAFDEVYSCDGHLVVTNSQKGIVCLSERSKLDTEESSGITKRS